MLSLLQLLNDRWYRLGKLTTFDCIFENSIIDKLSFNNNPDKIFIYIANLSNGNHNILKFCECLSHQEKSTANQYVTNNLSNNYIISRGILRYILSYYIKQEPHDISFSYNQYGKPFLK